MSQLTPPPHSRSWVPIPVTDEIRWQFNDFTNHIESLRAAGFSQLEVKAAIQAGQTVLDALYRLANRPDMENVWEHLSRATLKCVDIESFLKSYVRLAVYPGQPEDFWKSVPPLNEQRERLDEIADLAGKLSRKLGAVIPGKKYTSWNMLAVGVDALNSNLRWRDESKELYHNLLLLQEHNRNFCWTKGENACSLWLISAGAILAQLERELPALKELACLSKTCLTKPPKGGTKRYTRILIARLAGWVDHCVTEPHNQEIAITVTIALDLPTPVDEAYVRQVRKPSSRKKPSQNP